MNILQKIFKSKDVDMPTINIVQQEEVSVVSSNTNLDITSNVGELNDVNQEDNVVDIYNYIRYTEHDFLSNLEQIDVYYNEELRRLTYLETITSIVNKIDGMLNNNSDNLQINILDLGSGTGGMLVELHQFLSYLKTTGRLPETYVVNYTMVDFNKSNIDYCSTAYTNLSELYNIKFNFENVTYENYVGKHNRDIGFDIIICCRAFDYDLFNIHPLFIEEIQNNFLIEPSIKINSMTEYYKYILNELYKFLNIDGSMYIINQRYNEVDDSVFKPTVNDILDSFNSINNELKITINNHGINLDTFKIRKLK